MTELNYQALARELLTQTAAMQIATKAVSSSPIPAGAYGHGNGGLFSRAGLERPVINAMTLPYLGLMSALPSARGSVFDNPQYGIMTGVTASVGTNPVGVCDDPPTAGLMKLCTQMLPFGRFSRQTPVYDVDRFGRRRDRGDHVDLQFIGNPFQANGDNPMVPTIPNAQPNQALNNELAKALFQLAVAWARDFARAVYAGNPANNTAGGGYKEYFGLDLLINTGRRDAETGIACPAADSTIVTTGGLNISTNGGTVVNTFQAIMRQLKRNARRMGLDPATWVIAMRSDLFYELTRIWPCSYQTNGCQVTDANGQRVIVNGADQVAMRDEMRTGSFLWIDGERVPVVEDEAIAESVVGTGLFESDVYFVPLTVMGGMAATYFEYFDYDASGAVADANVFAPNTYFATDGGRFLFHKKPPQNFCVQLLAKTEPRLVLLTPQIAGRYTDLRYSPVIHERSSFPGDPYFANGGSVYGTAETFYSPTA